MVVSVATAAVKSVDEFTKAVAAKRRRRRRLWRRGSAAAALAELRFTAKSIIISSVTPGRSAASAFRNTSALSASTSAAMRFTVRAIDTVSAVVGEGDGCGEGCDVGTGLGSEDGGSVGSGDGVNVGAEVGCADGSCVGSGDGGSDGIELGCIDGDGVGSGLGRIVGKAVPVVG